MHISYIHIYFMHIKYICIYKKKIYIYIYIFIYIHIYFSFFYYIHTYVWRGFCGSFSMPFPKAPVSCGKKTLK